MKATDVYFLLGAFLALVGYFTDSLIIILLSMSFIILGMQR